MLKVNMLQYQKASRRSALPAKSHVLSADFLSGCTVYLRGLPQFSNFFYYWSNTFETWYIYVKQNFEPHLVLEVFYLVHRKPVIQRKRNFRTIFESILSPTILKQNNFCGFILFRISYSTNVMQYSLRFWDCYFLYIYYFFKPTFIFKSLCIFPTTIQNRKIQSITFIE